MTAMVHSENNIFVMAYLLYESVLTTVRSTGVCYVDESIRYRSVSWCVTVQRGDYYNASRPPSKLAGGVLCALKK